MELVLCELAGTNSKHYALVLLVLGYERISPSPLVQLTNYVLIDPPKDSPSVWPLGDPFEIVTRSAITDSFLCIDLPGGRMSRVDRPSNGEAKE